MSDTQVHAFRETREIRLQRLVYHLWTHLTPYQQGQLGPGIVKSGMGWALPAATLDHRDDNDWVTVDEIAYEYGLTESAVRNWQQRYNLNPVKGRYRWGDIKDALQRRNQRKHHNIAG